jgi:hydrogenase maturation protease
MTAPAVAVIGCGNPNRRDDGAGPRVVELLRQRSLPDHVGLYDAGTDGMAVMYRARGVASLVIVDARAPEGAPGAVYDVPGNVLEAMPPQSHNLHDFRWDHALYAGRRIYGEAFPDDIRVFLIEAESLDLGLGLSAPVEAAAHSVADALVQSLGVAEASAP